MEALSHELDRHGSTFDALTLLVRGAVDAIPGVDYASISVAHADGTVDTIVPTDSVIREADQLQYDLRQGACYDALSHGNGEFVVSTDLAATSAGRTSAPGPPHSGWGRRSGSCRPTPDTGQH